MSKVTYTDAGGASIKLLNLNGRHLTPVINIDQWESVLSMDTRSDDVFICTYPKSGTHWFWEILTMLTRGDPSPQSTEMVECMLDFHHSSKFDICPSPRVFTTHRYFDELPANAKKDRCKIVYILRDPKDIAVSYYNHIIKVKPLDYEGQFGDFLQLFLEGKVPFNSWWENVFRWSLVKRQYPDQPLLVLHYEDMKKDPDAVLHRLVEFLEVKADDKLIRDIIHNTSFDVMKKHKESLEFKGASRFKSHKNIMYRKGEVGDWKNWISQDQSQELINVFKEKLADANLGGLETARRYLTQE